MSFIVTPVVRKVDHNKHAISFSYSFQGDPVIQTSVGGLNINGTKFDISEAMLGNIKISSFKSLRFSASFGIPPAATTGADGDLYVLSSDGSVTTIQSSFMQVASGPTVAVSSKVCGVVPITGITGGSITFVKEIASFGGNLPLGIIMATLYDFDVAPFTMNGLIGGGGGV